MFKNLRRSLKNVATGLSCKDDAQILKSGFVTVGFFCVSVGFWIGLLVAGLLILPYIF